MPWEIRKSGSQFCVYKEGTEQKAGCHSSKTKAEAQVKALYANEKASADESSECPSCDRAFLSESVLSQHLETVHGSDAAREFSGKERKKAASSGAAMKDGSFPIKTVADLKNAISAYGRAKNKAAAKAHIIRRAKALGATNLLPEGWAGSDKAELMHSCEPCSRPFAGERSLFQHAAAVHGYDEAADRAASGVQAKISAPYLLGTAPWENGERRLIISIDRETGTRVLKDYETQYKQTDSDSAAAVTHSSHQSGTHGSSTSVSGLSCSACDRAFLSVRGLRDHAEAVHQDQALEATYEERRELVANALRKSLNPGLSYSRVYAYVSDMADDFFVYQVEGEEHYRKATYSIADDGVVTLGEGTPVRRRAVYETVGSD